MQFLDIPVADGQFSDKPVILILVYSGDHGIQQEGSATFVLTSRNIETEYLLVK